MQFPVIYLDPPWQYEVYSKATGLGRSAESHYRTMTWDDIAAMIPAINAIAADPCALALWTVPPSLDTAIEMFKAGGWRYVTKLFTWTKMNKVAQDTPFFGMGHFTRANSEDVLLFMRSPRTRNKESLKRLSKGVPQVWIDWERTTPRQDRIASLDYDAVNQDTAMVPPSEGYLAPIGRHSEKPEIFADRLAQLFPGPRIELFARKRRPGWFSVGWELDGLDITDSLARVANDQPLPVRQGAPPEMQGEPHADLFDLFDIPVSDEGSQRLH